MSKIFNLASDARSNSVKACLHVYRKKRQLETLRYSGRAYVCFSRRRFDSEHIKCPRDIWRLTAVPEHRLSTPINFKDSVKETPILRGASPNHAGLLVTDPHRALQYKQARQWEAVAGESAGFKDKGTLYKYRKEQARISVRLEEFSLNEYFC